MEVVNYVRDQIALGRWRPGEQIPFRTWFIENFSTTPNTVQKAFDQLRGEGFVVAIPHIGTSVANNPPFQNRHLILLYGDPERPQMLTQAILQAAQNIEASRNVKFDVEYILDKRIDDPHCVAVHKAVQAHQYSSVFFEAFSNNPIELAIASIDNVPMSGIFPLCPFPLGSLVVTLNAIPTTLTSTNLKPLFEECQKRELKKISIFDGSILDLNREVDIRNTAKAYNLECGPYHIQLASTSTSSLRLAQYAFRAVLAPEMPWQPEALVISDDNFVPIINKILLEFYGKNATSRFFIVAHGNLPLLPPTSVPIVFHGLDIEKTIASVIDYAESCINAPHETPILPTMFYF